MTVLDQQIMSNSLGGDRYITPEYLAPLPQKDGVSDKSPLQLLAQTCSQIGADTGPRTLDKVSKVGGMTMGNQAADKVNKSVPKSGSPTIVVSDAKVPFKPYEFTKDGNVAKIESKRASVNLCESSSKSTPVSSSSPGSSHSPNHMKNSDIINLSDNGHKTENKSHSNGSPPSVSTSSKSASETTPTLSSGMEILAGHPKDIPLGTYRPPGFDMSNPAFRQPFGGLPGYPPSSNVGGNVCRDPYCKDPGCPMFVYNSYMARLQAASAASRGLPPGYLELLEAQKMAALSGMGGLPPSSIPNIPSSLASSSPLGPGGPYICNWMNGRDYCGKRYTSAEELLVHLKTHTNLSASDSAMLNAGSMYSSLMNSSAAAQMLRGPGGAAGPVLPSALALQASRYSPYQRPGAPIPPSLANLGAAGLPPSLTGLPPHLSSLAGYPASLYALYGARL